jgi:hypothetical protein
VRWRGACGTSPTCSLAVGPVTSLSAEFAANAGAPAPPQRRGLTARIARIAVSGRGARRTIQVTVQVGAAATARVDILRGRRTITSRRRRLPGGRAVVRVPVREAARPGLYQVRLTVQDRAGRKARAAGRVRLRP